MKRTPKTIAGVILWAWLGGCGGGTLGGNGGMIGTITGAAGVTGPGSGSAAVDGGLGFAGFGGDIAPPPGGRGGAGGRGGITGGGGGTGGTVACTIDSPACGTLCGNGRIDSCGRQPAVGCPVQIVSEDCDGADVGNFNCESFGYSSGKPSCRSDCTIDLSPCSSCVPSASVFSCGPAPEHAVPAAVPEGEYLNAFALAAKDTEIGLALLSYRAVDGAAAVSFARLSPALQFIRRTTLDDGSQPGAFFERYAYGMAVAPIPSGWVVAVCGDKEIFLHALDDAGNDLGRTVVANVYGLQACAKPVLAKRPNGGPLLLWLGDEGLKMSMIAADGLSASPPLTIVGGSLTLSWESIGAAWVGDEFAVALPVDLTSSGAPYALRLLRVPADGTPRFVGDFWSGGVDGKAHVASDAAEVRVLFEGLLQGEVYPYDAGTVWWRRATDGSSPPLVKLATMPVSFGQSLALGFGDDTLVLLGSSYGSGLGIMRVAADGSVVTPLYDVIRSQYGIGPAYEMARRGPEAVIAWLGFDARLVLLRVGP